MRNSPSTYRRAAHRLARLCAILGEITPVGDIPPVGCWKSNDTSMEEDAMFNMKPLSYALRATLLSSALLAPTLLWAAKPLPSCGDLATDPQWGLAGNPDITGLTAVITQATVSPAHAAYCQINLTDVSLSGPQDGYLPGQTSHMRIRVGLPLSSADGGAGGVEGAWNGKVKSLGNGGFAGSVVAVTGSTDTGYVGTGTDTGHNGSITTPLPVRRVPHLA
jgi:hypothetical protein